MAFSCSQDTHFMRLAYLQALRGWGLCSPNPLVGAVVVAHDGQIVGRGHHRRAGSPHAEPLALQEAGLQAAGGTIYVTLEPCSSWGRTPPCTEQIIKAGIKRVVIGCVDANPAHQGKAASILQNAGIKVSCGIMEHECQRLNEAFFWWITKKRPFVTLKMAMTLDGKIATAKGDSQWISSEQARRKVQQMRRWADAVMAGGNTVRIDDASLTVRKPEQWPKQPKRIVWTAKHDLPPEAKLWHADPKQPPKFAKPQSTAQWLDFLRALGREDVTSLLLEGGGELAGAALQAGIVNKIVFFVASKILGGRDSRPVVGGHSPALLSESITLEDRQCRSLGPDLLITGYCSNVYRFD